MAVLINGFLVGYFVDGVTGLLLGLAPGVPLLPGIGHLFSGVVLLGALIVYLLLAVFSRLPCHVLAPMGLVVLFLGFFGAMPLPLFLGFDRTLILVNVFQLLVGAAAMVVLRYGSPVRRWFFRESDFMNSRFSFRHFLLFTGGNIFLAGPALILYLAFCISISIAHFTGGFVRVGWHGVRVEERQYVRDDKRVRLVPMAHIGSRQFYDQLRESFSGSRTVVLAEGVTDTGGRLRHFDGKSYKRIAQTMKLDVQDQHKLLARTNYRRADVDASQFSDSTIEFLDAVGVLLRSPTLPEMLTAYRRVNALASGGGGRLADNQLIEALYSDLLELRNRRCLEEVAPALEEYDLVVIPWGAAHMPGIEKGILERGFRRSSSNEWFVVRW
ncbi:MAG: hypothetical protein PHV34_16670 [Verrucomicrobiae bacterium]|nr:hypothetical protein [Verrucomicrobiae bacterium]